jgi:hypothetical protein
MQAFRHALPGLPDTNAEGQRLRNDLQEALRTKPSAARARSGAGASPEFAAALDSALEDVPFAATLGTCYGYLAEQVLDRQEVDLGQYAATKALLAERFVALDELERRLLLPMVARNVEATGVFSTAALAQFVAPVPIDLFNPHTQVSSGAVILCHIGRRTCICHCQSWMYQTCSVSALETECICTLFPCYTCTAPVPVSAATQSCVL